MSSNDENNEPITDAHERAKIDYTNVKKVWVYKEDYLDWADPLTFEGGMIEEVIIGYQKN